ncbi:MAG: response regulator [Campylobacterota bacterium]|nr:response regulator [Campylobacterota bacterium]
MENIVEKRAMELYNHIKDCDDKKYKILVVDDSKTFNKKISDALIKLGHIVTQSYTLSETKELIDKKFFDFILLDLILPDGEGDELIDSMSDELRAKVIVLSGDNDNQRRNHIFDSGILDYFSKTNPTHMIIEDVKNLLCVIEKNSSINILLIDDSAFMRRMLRGILSPKRFNIYEAKDAQMGEIVLDEEDIHLLLLDYEMPGMNGIELLEKIKKDTKYLELPVIMLSGNDSKEVISRALKHGASDFLKKPFVTEELLLKCDLQVKNYINVKWIQQKEKELAVALQNKKDAEEHKSIFLANMSHEIRTPLNAIMGFVDILEEEEDDKTKLNYLNTIQKSGDLLLNLINDILDFSKIESNKLDINKEVFLLDELYQLVRSLYNPMVIEKGLTLNTIIDPKLPKYFNSDFLRIKQIITNLLGNAIKFTSKGGSVTFELSLTDDRKYVRFSVKDTGIGIDPSNHKKVFELFSQAESTTTKKFGGTGLGLSISSKLVALLDGEIGIESEIGKGSCFFFTLPITEIDMKNLTYHKKEEKKRPDIKFNNHILLVEDNKTNQQFMAIILKKLGLTFDIANDGLEAVEFFKTNEYDLILMDENMPNMSGVEATKVIRSLEREQNLKYLPIVSLTANAIKGDRERFIDAGMDEHLTKPLNKQKLTEVLDELLNKETIVLEAEQELKGREFNEIFYSMMIGTISAIDAGIEKENFNDIIRYVNFLKIASMKYKYKDIFELCLNIEQSATDENIQDSIKFVAILKKEI